jgi:hypothetical protein
MNRTVAGPVIVNGRYVTETELSEMIAHRMARLQENGAALFGIDPDYPYEKESPMNTPTPQQIADIENRIKYHRPDEDAINRIAVMRGTALMWAEQVLEYVPAGREQALALTKIEEALMWANAGIARDPEHFAEEVNP